MNEVRPADYDLPAIRQAIVRERAVRRTLVRSRWWFPLVGVLLALACCWGLLKADQLFADQLIWPTAGAQFVEVGPRPTDPDQTGDPMVVVVAGLNRKDGTGIAEALMPSLSVEHTRVFSLVYGSGISDRDILDKFDALIGRFQPSQVSFFGSSMGGDVVLNLAAHTQDLRTGYVRGLLALPAATDPAVTAAADSLLSDGAVAAQADRDSDRAPDVGNDASGRPGLLAGALPAGARPAGALPAGPLPAGALPAGALPTGSLPPAGVPQEDPSLLSAPAEQSAQTADRSASAASVGQSLAARTTTEDAPTAPPPPRLGTIFLDCSPLGADDVRDSSRTKADALTAVMEATDTEGGAGVRMAAEVLGQQQQWSSGRFPFVQVRTDELLFKIDQVWQQKISAPGISTQLIKDQYGVIRRTDIDDVADSLLPGTRIVYFLPEDRHDDRTVRVERVEQTLRQLATEKAFDLRVIEIPGAHHASAESNSDAYRLAIDAVNRDIA